MDETAGDPVRRTGLGRRLSALTKPYAGEPPPGLYNRATPDLLIRVAGTAIPHFLSVVMRLGGDRELPDLPTAVNRRVVRVIGRKIVAHDPITVELIFAAPDGGELGRWHAGAHVDLHLPSGRTRQYSLCGDPSRRDEYRIAVRRIAAPDGGSAEVHGLSVGQSVEVGDPRNAFMMPLPGSGSRAERLHFIAGGIGITPILPMAKSAEKHGVPWLLRYTGRHRGSLPFLDELEAFGEKVRVRTDDECGLPNAADLLDGVDDKTAVYMCGPPPMMELVRRSIPAGFEVHSERFSPPPVVNGAPFELVLARTGGVVPVRADQSALAALQEARPDVSYSCRQGFCGTCVQQVTAGEVEHRDNTLTGRQRELGQMLVCVSRAKRDGGQLVLDI